MNKVCWITGAAGGIGSEIARTMANENYHLFLTDINNDRLNELYSELKDITSVDIFPYNVGDYAEYDSLKHHIDKNIGRIDILINAAGISPKGEHGRCNITEISYEEWKSVLNINLDGAFLCTQVALSYMKEQNSGNIINIVSLAARTYSVITGVHYAVSKTALISLTRQIAGEYGSYNIRSNAVAPGRINTEMIKDVADSVNENAISMTPLKRLGEASEVANVIKFLVSDDASFVTGAVIDVNGGRLMI